MLNRWTEWLALISPLTALKWMRSQICVYIFIEGLYIKSSTAIHVILLKAVVVEPKTQVQVCWPSNLVSRWSERLHIDWRGAVIFQWIAVLSERALPSHRRTTACWWGYLPGNPSSNNLDAYLLHFVSFLIRFVILDQGFCSRLHLTDLNQPRYFVNSIGYFLR